MEQIIKEAYAKINLGLDVIGKRANGYHDLRMVMQMVDIHDTITICKQPEAGIVLSTNKGELPINEDNLIYKAAKLLMEEKKITTGVRINLEKRIPIAAGMAGGSTDCAATLEGMNELFQLGFTKKELMEYGVKLGADVPYCLMKSTALSEGIGEVLTPVSPMPDCYLVIAKPPISVSTKYVYEHLNIEGLVTHPDIDGMIEQLAKKDLKAVASYLENVLETVTIPEYPVIEEIKVMMINQGGIGALMSGSGPTVFGIFEDEVKAKQAAKEIQESKKADQVYIVKPKNFL